MPLSTTVARARRLIGKRPGYLLERAIREMKCELDRWLAPRRQHVFGRERLLALAGVPSIDQLWRQLQDRSFPALTIPIEQPVLDRIEPGESKRICEAAEMACSRTVNLLGMGPTMLGIPINWSRDYRTNLGWDAGFARSIDFVNRDRPSDVKIPWEISRLQWLIPAGQAYLLSGDERYAATARDILDEWIEANPLAYTVNWASTMEAALRILTWTWLFHVFARSPSWSQETFRCRFLSTLYLHGDFTLRHIEKSDVNGNHYTADLAGLVFAGLFFGNIGDAARWTRLGWSSLISELPQQVFADGVDYEASCAYHRFVFELFMWPALYRRCLGLDVPDEYNQRLLAMARFTAAYMRSDGTSPLWGDADDARALPFGGQPVGDHRYVLGIAAIALNDAQLASWFSGPRSELTWIFGPERVAMFPHAPAAAPSSSAHKNGGCFVMRDGATHVFIDCGPVGLAGRGGHGHNDALSFEAWLEGVPLLVDSGSYVYTASFEQRNRYRSTGSHNTPMVDLEEINRFVDPDNLWSLHDDARPVCLKWHCDENEDVFVGRHNGYARLGIEVERTIRFDKRNRSLEITDRLNGPGTHRISIPLHLAPGVSLDRAADVVRLYSAGREFEVINKGDGWSMAIEQCSISPSYGIALPSQRLAWGKTGPFPTQLTITIRPVRSLDR
jgi:uncharacterized heparinase superfamily protein